MHDTCFEFGAEIGVAELVIDDVTGRGLNGLEIELDSKIRQVDKED